MTIGEILQEYCHPELDSGSVSSIEHKTDRFRGGVRSDAVENNGRRKETKPAKKKAASVVKQIYCF